MEKEDIDKFSYSYTAPTEEERREIESIRRNFVNQPNRRNDLNKLRWLYNRVKNPPIVVAFFWGLLGLLALAGGLIHIFVWHNVLLGWLLVSCGVILTVSNVFFYRWHKRFRRRMFGADIIALSDSLLGEETK